MNIRPLGLSGVQQRVQEIRSKLGDAFEAKLQNASSAKGLTSAQWVPGLGVGIGPMQPFNVTPANANVGPAQLTGMADQIADEYGLDQNLFRALINAESSWNPNSVSPAGAKGLTQLMPDTARGLGVSDPFDPEQNLRGGAKYLKSMLERFGSVELALAAYNAGPGAVRRYNGIPPFAETQNYVKKITGAINR